MSMFKFPWTKEPLSRRVPSASLSQPYYRALIEIRDNPKHAKRKAKEALTGSGFGPYLFRALKEIAVNPEDSRLIAERAIADVRLARRLIRALEEIKSNPRDAVGVASLAVIEGAKAGAK